MNKISVITVVKNGMPFLIDAIESFEMQNFINKELIIVCSPSEDGTEEYCKSLKRKNIKVFFNNTKIYKSLNFGIEKAEGNIVGILHSDDIFYDKNVLSKINEIEEKEKFAICYGSIVYCSRNNIKKIIRVWKEDFNKKKNYWTPPHTSTFVNKNKILVKYDESYDISGDTKYLFEILREKSYKPSFLPSYTTIMRGGGISTSLKNIRLQIKKIIEDLKIFYYFKLNLIDYFKKIFSKYEQILIFKKKNIENDYINFFSDTQNEIRLINSVENLNYNKNFILSGLNLAFLAYYSSYKIIKNRSLINWPDGIFCKRFGRDIKKIAGRNLIRNLKLDDSIKKLHIIGNLEEKSKIWLEKLYKREIKITQLPYAKIENLSKFLPTTNEEELCIITLPTPKQEQCANLIANISQNYKIICIGGAINMASGIEPEIPKFLDKFGLEFIWRLKTDPHRRLVRLLETFFIYILNEIRGRFKLFFVKKI